MISGKRIGFIGAGNMAEALIKGLLQASVFPVSRISASDVDPARRRLIGTTYGITVEAENPEVAAKSDILLLAVKPQVMGEALASLKGSVTAEHLVISIAAGVPIAFLTRRLPPTSRIIRVMPNTPALVLQGASALAAGEHTTPEDVEAALTIFRAVGKAVVVSEHLLDAVTGLSGSGPAYIFIVIEALADAGVKMGLPRETAMLLATQTVLGAAAMALETGKHPGQLKDMVTSPGGTTLAGLHALESAGLRAAFLTAVEAATRRSQELGREQS